MALGTPTELDTTVRNNNAAAITSASISPTGGALLIAIMVTQGSPQGMTFSTTDSLTGTGSWTEITKEHDTGDSAYVTIAYALAGSSPGSGTVTVTGSDNGFRAVLTVLEVTGEAVTPIPQNNDGGNSSATLAIVLGSSPASDSITLGAVNSRGAAGIIAGTGFTELVDAGSNGNTVRLQVQYDATSPDDTVDWSGLNTVGNAAVAIEIAAAGGAPSAGFTQRSYPRGTNRGIMRGAA